MQQLDEAVNASEVEPSSSDLASTIVDDAVPSRQQHKVRKMIQQIETK